MSQEIAQILKDCNNVVVFSDVGLGLESGISDMRGDDIAYDVEVEYGFSPEEILTRNFMGRRTDIFYKYYKEHLLQLEKLIPNEGHNALVRLEHIGKLNAIITKNVHGLHQKAGSNNVVELFGSIHNNYCSSCGKWYPAEYIAEATKEPKCEKCNLVLKPGVSLFGDALDNGVMSRAMEYISGADVLLVVGVTTDSRLLSNLLRDYNGDKLISIQSEQDVNIRPDYVAYGKCSEILPQLI